ncbi:TPA_asm: hypothetical protein G0G79_28785, partial [Salmonella enterica]|nr:hypothetical protein [Salmonella enterica]EAW1232715.1 hypothetical protein [Salmonella enterica subsp. enterica]EBU9482304.1 hypothetical protein [Salmonella enterica subsp. enterica serovar Monschaui]EAO7894611.1 hypothetical protein [Salmonella enterica]MDY49375.1 hypothetical protein [Salmonella enterica]
KKPLFRWKAPLREPFHASQVFFSCASSNAKSEPTGKPAGPRDLAFDEFGNGERAAKFFAAREALAGVGAQP